MLVMPSRAVDAIVVSVTVAVSVNVMVLSSIGAAVVKLSKCVSSKQPHVIFLVTNKESTVTVEAR